MRMQSLPCRYRNSILRVKLFTKNRVTFLFLWKFPVDLPKFHNTLNRNFICVPQLACFWDRDFDRTVFNK